MNENRQSLQISTMEPRFFFACSLDMFAVDDEKVGKLLTTSKWHQELLNLNEDEEFLSKFTKLTNDLPNYPDNPSPEKRPINEIYFDKHSSLTTEYTPTESVNIREFKLEYVNIRVFEHGGITARCRFTQTESDSKRGVDEAVSVTRDLREKGREILYAAIQDFFESFEKLFASIELSIPEGGRQIHKFERYEYIDCELNIVNSGVSLNKEKILGNPDHVNKLREIVGFLRMSKPYAWPDYSPDFLEDFLSKKELGNRSDELWFVNSQRFIRYYPDSQISETSSYAQDIILGLENLLSLRALYKTMLDNVRSNIPEIPESTHYNNNLTMGEIENIQSQLSLLSYMFSRTIFPSDIRFYTQSPHANKVIENLEREMQLPSLSSALETEMEKLQATIDSFGSLITHHRNVALQRKIMLYTVFVGLVGAGIAFIDIFL